MKRGRESRGILSYQQVKDVGVKVNNMVIG